MIAIAVAQPRRTAYDVSADVAAHAEAVRAAGARVALGVDGAGPAWWSTRGTRVRVAGFVGWTGEGYESVAGRSAVWDSSGGMIVAAWHRVDTVVRAVVPGRATEGGP